MEDKREKVITYDKLVRDRIPEIIAAAGKNVLPWFYLMKNT